MVAISVALAIGLDIAGLGVIGRNGDTVSIPTSRTLPTTFAITIQKLYCYLPTFSRYYPTTFNTNSFKDYLPAFSRAKLKD